jgi:hypothetical protein
MKNIKEIINNPKIEFALVASSKLKQLITDNDHPFIKPIPQNHKLALLQSGNGVGVAIEKSIVIKYIDTSLDVRQKFILDLCDIRAVGDWNVVKPVIE